MKIVIRISRQPDATYIARCPALPGCVVRAKSRDEVRNRIRDAVDGYISSLNTALPREIDEHYINERQHASH